MHLSTLIHTVAVTTVALHCLGNPIVTLAVLSVVAFVARDQPASSCPEHVEPAAPLSASLPQALDNEKEVHNIFKEQDIPEEPATIDEHDILDLEEQTRALAFRAGAAEARIEIMEMERAVMGKAFAAYRERTMARFSEKADVLELKDDELQAKDDELASLQAQLADIRLDADTRIDKRDARIRALETERDEALRQCGASDERATDALAQAEVALFQRDQACQVAKTGEEDTTTLMLALAKAEKHAHIAERELGATSSRVHEAEQQVVVLGVALAIGAREVCSLKRDLDQANHELASSVICTPPPRDADADADVETLLAALEQERRRADHHMTRADRADLSFHNRSCTTDTRDSELEEALEKLEATESALKAERALSSQYLDAAWKYHAAHQEADSSLTQHKEKVSHLSNVVVEVKTASSKLRARCELLEAVLARYDGAKEELARCEALEAEAAELRRSEADASLAQMLLIDLEGKVTTDPDAIHITGQSQFTMHRETDPLPGFVQRTSADSVKETLSTLASFASSTSSIMSSGSFVNLLDLFPMPPSHCHNSIPNASRRPARRSELIDSDSESDESFEAGSSDSGSTTSAATATTSASTSTTTSMTSGPEEEDCDAPPSSSKFVNSSSTLEKRDAHVRPSSPVGQYLEGFYNDD